jgi:ribosome-associated translation inhibitor RaiA
MDINYIFRYHNSSDKIYSDSKSDFETIIEERLSTLEDQSKIQIDSISFNFDYEGSHDKKYVLDTSIDSPSLTYAHKEEDKDPQVIVHKSIDSILHFVRKEKDKLSK